MTREHKHRAWDGEQMQYSNKEQTIWSGPLNGNIVSNRESKQIENEFMMDYIGLKDKNKIWIWECDIVEYYNPESGSTYVWTGLVEYFGYGFGGSGFRCSSFDNPGDIFSEGTEHIKVLGNKFQHKDLLEQTAVEPIRNANKVKACRSCKKVIEAGGTCYSGVNYLYCSKSCLSEGGQL